MDNSAPVYKGFDSINHDRSRIILLGDTQRTSFWEIGREKNPEIPKKILDETAKRNPAFVIHLGDLVVRGGSTGQWKKFDTDNEAVLSAKIPYLPILGNHDYWMGLIRPLKNYFARFPHLDGRLWYSFEFTQIGLIFLNSNLGRLSERLINKQEKWYQDELTRLSESIDIRCIFVCIHHPPYSNSDVEKPKQKIEDLCVKPLRNLGKSVLVFSGHCNSYERFECHKLHFFVTGGGGGPSHRLKSENTMVECTPKSRKDKNRFFHFCQVDISDSHLDFKVVRLNDDKESFSDFENFEVKLHENEL